MEKQEQKDYKDFIASRRTGKPCSKDKALDALEILQEIIFDYGEEDIIGQAAMQLPTLLDFFSPKISAKAVKDPIAWAATAPDPKDTSLFKQKCVAWRGNIIGTDGRVLHMAKDKAQGIANFQTLSIDGQPDGGEVSPIEFERVMPNPEDCQTVTISKQSIIGTGKDSKYIFVFSNGLTGHYSKKFFDKMTAAGETEFFSNTSNVFEYDPEKTGPIIGIDTPERYAVLMPIRHD